jgi:hypothetical protein
VDLIEASATVDSATVDSQDAVRLAADSTADHAVVAFTVGAASTVAVVRMAVAVTAADTGKPQQ